MMELKHNIVTHGISGQKRSGVYIMYIIAYGTYYAKKKSEFQIKEEFSNNIKQKETGRVG